MDERKKKPQKGKELKSSQSDSRKGSGRRFQSSKSRGSGHQGSPVSRMPVDIHEVDLRSFMIHTPNYRLSQVQKEIQEETQNINQRMEKVEIECRVYLCPKNYLKMLGDLYDQTGEEMMHLYLYYYDEYVASHRRQTLTWELLPRTHIEKIDDEIKRLQNIMRERNFQQIRNFSSRCSCRNNILHHASEWLTGQHCILVDHLDSFFENWEEFDMQHDKTLHNQVQQFMDSFTKAVSKTRQLKTRLFHKADEDEEEQIIDFDLKIPKTAMPSSGLMEKSRHKFKWAVKKIKDFLSLCEQATESAENQKVFQNGLLLFSNMMEVVATNFDEVSEIDENLADLHKKLAEVCSQIEGCNNELSEATALHEELQEKYQELTASLNKTLERRAQLQRKLEAAENILECLVEETEQEEQSVLTEAEAGEGADEMEQEEDQISALPEEMELEIGADVHAEALSGEPESEIPHKVLGTEAECIESATQELKFEMELPESTQTEQAELEIQKEEAESEIQKEPAEFGIQKEVAESEIQKEEAESEIQKEPAEFGIQKEVAESEIQKEEAESEIKKEAESEKKKTQKPLTHKGHAQSPTQRRRAGSPTHKEGAELPTSKGHVESPTQKRVLAGKKPQLKSASYSKLTPEEKAEKVQELMHQLDSYQDTVCELRKQYHEIKADAIKIEQSLGLNKSQPRDLETSVNPETAEALEAASRIAKERVMESLPASDPEILPPMVKSNRKSLEQLERSDSMSNALRRQNLLKQSEKGVDMNFSGVSSLPNSSGTSHTDPKPLIPSAWKTNSLIRELDGQSHQAAHLQKKTDKTQEKTQDVKWQKKSDDGHSGTSVQRSQSPTCSSQIRAAEVRRSNSQQQLPRLPKSVYLGPARDSSPRNESSHSNAHCVSSFHEMCVGSVPVEQEEETLPGRPENISRNWSPPISRTREDGSSTSFSSQTRKRLGSTPSVMNEPEKIQKEEVQTVCWEILNQFLSLGLKLAAILENHNFSAAADGVRKAHAILDGEFSTEAFDEVYNIASAVDKYFAEISRLVQKTIKSINVKTTEDRVKEMREESLRELSQKTANTQNKINSLEEQFQTLWFMHLQLCDAIRVKLVGHKFEAVKHDGELIGQFKEKPVTHAEWTLKLPPDFININSVIIWEAFNEKKISEKCFEMATACIDEVDSVVNAILPEIAHLYIIGHQLMHVEMFGFCTIGLTTQNEKFDIVQEYRQLHENNLEMQNRWKTWEVHRKEVLSRQFQIISWNMLLIKERRPRVILDAWFLFSQILIETGIKLVFPEARPLIADEVTCSQYTKILNELKNVKGVPLINAENYQDVMTSGKLPVSYKKVHAGQLEDPSYLSLDNRQSVAQTTASHGFGVRKNENLRNRDIVKSRQASRLKFCRSESIDDVQEVPEPPGDESAIL